MNIELDRMPIGPGQTTGLPGDGTVSDVAQRPVTEGERNVRSRQDASANLTVTENRTVEPGAVELTAEVEGDLTRDDDIGRLFGHYQVPTPPWTPPET